MENEINSNRLRELTSKELETVSGGYEPPLVTVVGNRPSDFNFLGSSYSYGIGGSSQISLGLLEAIHQQIGASIQ